MQFLQPTSLPRFDDPWLSNTFFCGAVERSGAVIWNVWLHKHWSIPLWKRCFPRPALFAFNKLRTCSILTSIAQKNFKYQSIIFIHSIHWYLNPSSFSMIEFTSLAVCAQERDVFGYYNVHVTAWRAHRWRRTYHSWRINYWALFLYFTQFCASLRRTKPRHPPIPDYAGIETAGIGHPRYGNGINMSRPESPGLRGIP